MTRLHVYALKATRDFSSTNYQPELFFTRVGQLFVASDIAKVAGVDATTVQSWVSLLAANAVVFPLPAYFSNLNK
jgi:hypothetical protein